MSEFEKVIESRALEPKLRELVKLRTSKINGCAFVDMHTKAARAFGEDEQRHCPVAVWHEVPLFTPRERAALAWTDALALLPESGTADEVYEAIAREFDGEHGRIDAAMLEGHVSGLSAPIYYTVGPAGIVQAIRTTLVASCADETKFGRGIHGPPRGSTS